MGARAAGRHTEAVIENTFIFLQGIGQTSEQRLWREGIRCWDDFLSTSSIAWIAQEKKRLYDEQIAAAKERLQMRDAYFFARLLKPREHWRLFPVLRDHAVALDIETNGYGARQGGYVTVVGLYDGFDYRALVRGSSLSTKRLEQELSRYLYLITFFGTVFDLPFLQENLAIKYTGLHFDLCFAARRVGMRGGLKILERAVGIERSQKVQGLDGRDAVYLWRAAQQGDGEALGLLVEYNRSDTENLFPLADILYTMLKAMTGFDQPPIGGGIV